MLPTKEVRVNLESQGLQNLILFKYIRARRTAAWHGEPIDNDDAVCLRLENKKEK